MGGEAVSPKTPIRAALVSARSKDAVRPSGMTTGDLKCTSAWPWIEIIKVYKIKYQISYLSKKH